MLETTLSTSFTPGTNVKGQVSGANWSYLLPCLELDRIICFGAPPLTTLATLSRLSQEVMVICHNSRQAQAVHALGEKNELANVHATTGSSRLAPLSSSSADLILIVGWRNTWRFGRYPAMTVELKRLLKPGALVYFEAGRPLGSRAVHNLVHYFGTTQLLWLTPITGEMLTAVPLQDDETVQYFVQHRLYSPLVHMRPLKQVERFLNRHAFFSRFTQRYGVLVGQEADDQLYRPPQYLCKIACEAGMDINHHRWGLVAHGQYSSRKVLFFLFDRVSPVPEYIIKMTRDPAFNGRLENEYRALTLLHEKGLGDYETLPQPLFLGSHGGLTIVGETMIDGMPFRQRTRGTADDVYGHAAIEWLTNLGVATADPTSATSAQVAKGLWQLFVQFLGMYCLTSKQVAFLANQIEAIGRHPGPFPLVFQHGDPGTWNIMVTRSGQIAFLDWEAAESHGMPLWDLFYFLRSYCTWAARQRGTRNSLKGFAQHFLAESFLNPLLIDATGHYVQQLALTQELIEPLFYTCWMHRALKEVTRLSPTSLEGGHYVNLLRLCIDRHNIPPLHRLFSGEMYRHVTSSGRVTTQLLPRIHETE